MRRARRVRRAIDAQYPASTTAVSTQPVTTKPASVMTASPGCARVDERARSARTVAVAGRDPLGNGLLELAILTAFLERLEPYRRSRR